MKIDQHIPTPIVRRSHDWMMMLMVTRAFLEKTVAANWTRPIVARVAAKRLPVH